MTRTEPEPTTETPAFPDPADRARPGITGTPVELADGRTWVLADGIPDLDRAVWSSLYDDNRLRGAYEWPEVALAAAYLLMANYRLELAEAHVLICGADLPPLIPAVETALFGIGTSAGTFADWALVSLWRNSIDPARVPPRLLWPILNGLVKDGKADAPADAIRSERSALESAKVRAFVQSRPAQPAASPPGP